MEDADQTRWGELLKCPVCHDTFKDPRQLPCGHSMCMDCLANLLDHSTDSPFRCPDCRADFGQVVELQKSYALASIAEDFRLIKKRRETLAECVYCDCCPETTTAAFKSCLKCEVSLCREHAKDHLELPAFTGHPLVDPLSDLLERKCPQHRDQVLRYYCSSSRRYVCNMCALESKQLGSASDASAVLRRQLTDYMDQHFITLQQQIKESIDAVSSQQEKQKGNPLDRLNGVTVVLLSLWFIVLYYAYSYSVENQTLADALERQQSRVHHIYPSIAGHMADHPLKRLSGEDEGSVMLDLDTASRLLGLSADLLTVERVKAALHYPISDGRFDQAPQVLSAPCFSSGAHVWEVEAEGCWDIAVSYRSVPRRSRDGSSSFGYNSESWSLSHSGQGELFAFHDGHKTALSGSLRSSSSRIAVEVNFEEGRISFSAVSSTKTLLHEFQAELTQPVCLGLGLHHVDPPSRASIVKVS
ncbi:E3 ubiquitin-protein ligase TRIM11-like [Gambusia affinis]|uniref:E3 ubiquitin-protein ligase TRIM11-like n=1 Tax=Gambusia affinis TaxID=33528 RepID=UPI001CDC2F15|nr:E3 ubiquitin-protein ligase TRIM11-like [Gambusia affinis]XP_043989259.1 E3 ubiquitin-protein ligase TRIM11-like [Gambusia affinis]XP_043989260.1 E3 ubiquitin-protein ligase TRIM11-like [Gambusia affinis]